MIEDVFCALHDAIMEAGIFNVGYEYAELIQRNSSSGNKTVQPMYYEGGGYKPIQNFDVGGMFYLRKNGGTQVSEVAQVYGGCNGPTVVLMTIPIRCVAVVLRDKFGDDRFADDTLAATVIAKIQGSLDITNTQESYASTTQIQTDAYTIWPQENLGLDFKEKDVSRFAYAAVDFNVTIKADVSCLQSCVSYPY